ncbi:MAG: FAD-dependent oxidoreductase [Candidatus Nanopelagicales bacterium]
MPRPLRVAVVGSGPSGLYAADALANQEALPAEVDVIDRLPVPFGLVRYGVAPDHLSIRSVRDTLDKVLDRRGVRFLGNVRVGGDIGVADLHDCFDAVIWTYGASGDRRLGIPGEDLAGSVAATDFVAWYCGHPDADRALFEDLVPRASGVVVVGIGNVAVDVTRVLAKTVAELEHTDMPQHVLEALGRSQVTDIHVLGRRGPAQATFTTKELRELGELADADILVHPADLDLDPASQAIVESDKAIARNIEVMRGWAGRSPEGRGRRIHLRFFARPVELRGSDAVQGVVVERTRLTPAGGAEGTGELYRIEANVVVRSVGYRGTALDEVPFDAQRNVIPHADGRVQRDGAAVPGEYVAGWIKRGPTGIIGTNKKDAAATVASLLEDAVAGVLPEPASPTATEFDALLAERGVEVVTTAGWRRIDAAERAQGAVRGRDRTTIHDAAALLGAARS